MVANTNQKTQKDGQHKHPHCQDEMGGTNDRTHQGVIQFEPIVVQKGKLKVVLDWQNNGLSGKYSPNPDDPEGDSPVLNITFYKKDYTRWFPIAYSQNTTYLLATDPRSILEEGVNLVFQSFSKSNEIDWSPQYFRQLAYIHIRGEKAAIDLPFDSQED